MGLRHPVDLAAWQRWDARRHVVRRSLGLVRRTAARAVGLVRRDDETASPLFLATRGERPPVAVMLESGAASSVLALVAPVGRLAAAAVYAPFDPAPYLPGDGWAVRTVPGLDLARQLPDAGTVAAAGHYLPLGAAAFEQASARHRRFVVVQHGLLTPFAPPLPPGAHLLAWSQADADYWRSGRGDVTTGVAGSQLLWEAGHDPAPPLTDDRPVFLGQLHGAELPRAGLTRAAVVFCRLSGATYRPHPSERDRVSRLQHQAFERLGIEVDRTAVPLRDLARPVAAAFSTGLLEAAARGLPAWAFYPSPPAWLRDFWARYGLSEWGAEPTPAPPQPAGEPASVVARVLAGGDPPAGGW